MQNVNQLAFAIGRSEVRTELVESKSEFTRPGSQKLQQFN